MKMVLRILLTGLFSCTLYAAPRPNIVIIFNDDQGYQDLGCFGSPDIKTSRVDQMAEEGMRFTDFYVASPVCSASRAGLLTGCYPQRVGVHSVFFPNGKAEGLNPEYVTIAETLKRAGYATAAVGKWHLGDHPEFLPTNQGFDSYYGIPYSNDMWPAKTMKYAADCLFREGQSFQTLEKAFAGELDRRGNPRSMQEKVPLMRDTECIEFPADQSTITRRYADEGIRFISENVKADKPFFLYLANSMPHVPLFASEPFKGKSKRGLYGDVIEEIDYNTGRILDHLKKLGVEENTLVVFTSDNGPWLKQGDDAGSALPLFEGKFTTFEGGCRVPCVMKWPAKIPAGSICAEPAATIDLHPTLARLAGATLPEAEPDGENILDLMNAKPGAETPHENLFFVYGKRAWSVRSGDWKYNAKMNFTTMGEGRSDEKALYNLKEDIGETTNLIDQHPEIADRLANALDEHLRRIGIEVATPDGSATPPAAISGNVGKPNIILILADDLGYECVGANGGTSYRTPVLDQLAENGMRFEHCYAQPLCTPSRVKLLTGTYNVRNYTNFGELDRSQTTFAGLFRQHGYATCIAGKWQLGKEPDAPQHFGFDEALLWQHTRAGRKVIDGKTYDKRYVNPCLEQNGIELDYEQGEYGPDLAADAICDFMRRKKDQPFLVYYPMILTHCPFVPTPDSADWDPASKGSPTYKGDAAYFGDMVRYMDRLVGHIVKEVDSLGLRKNTLILFIGDNGTDKPIVSECNGRLVAGRKGSMTDGGTHVPFIASWPGIIPKGTVSSDLVDFSDFFPTLCETVGIPVPPELKIDGRSLLPQLKGEKGDPRKWAYCWFSRDGKTQVKEWARNQRYKLYRTGEFYDISNDVLEENPLADLTPDARQTRLMLQQALDQYKDARPDHLAVPK